MQELEQLIKLYHNAFIISLVLGLIFLALTVFLFFKFKIKKIIDMKTGRIEKQTIQRMEEVNALTGKLRQEPAPSKEVVRAPQERIQYPKTSPNLQVENQDCTTPLNGGSQETTLLNNSCETTLLSQEGETTLLNCGDNTTAISQISEMAPASEGNHPSGPSNVSQVPEKKLPGMFKVDKELLWVHTEEVL